MQDFHLYGDRQHHAMGVTVQQDQGSREVLLPATDYISHQPVQHLIVRQEDVPFLGVGVDHTK